MDPVKLIQGGVTVVNRADVDTDQIIPAKYLKRVERTGFGEFLFDEWRRDPSFELPKNPILAAGAVPAAQRSHTSSPPTTASRPYAVAGRMSPKPIVVIVSRLKK